MRQKQKKLNKLSDMGGLARRITPQEQERLFESRIVKFQSHKLLRQSHSTIKRLLYSEDNHVAGAKPSSNEGQMNNLPKPDTLHFFGRARTWFGRKIPTTRTRGPGPFQRSLPKQTPAIAGFVSIALLLLSVFPLLQSIENKRLGSRRVLGVATAAYVELESGGQALLKADYTTAHTHLSQAYAGFGSAVSQLQDLGTLVNSLPQSEDGHQLFRAAQTASLALQYLTVGMNNFQSLRVGPSGLTSASSSQADLLTGLDNFQNALKYLGSLKSDLSGLHPESLPQEYRVRVEALVQLLDQVTPGVEQMVKVHQVLQGVLGGETKSYLILFQNSRELRATGGFIGTYGYLILNQGQIGDLKIESIYNPDGQLKERITPPRPLQKYLTQAWGMRDSNWFFDFPTTAKKTAEFFEKETGLKVDGVLAFTPAVFERLMAIAGPIAMPEYYETLTSQNFTDVVQYQTSVAYDRKLNQPKKFLADFAPRLLQRLSALDSQASLELLEVILDSLQRKDILLSSFDRRVEGEIEALRWNGAVRKAPSDYLAIVDSNVGGGKTDQNITEAVDVEIKILPDGSAAHRLKMHLTHTRGAEKEFPTNTSYIRIFLPTGSRVTFADGFDVLQPTQIKTGGSLDPDLALIESTESIDPSGMIVSQESGKTVFANWVILPPDTTRDLILEYLTPPIVVRQGSVASYSMLFQKQPGGRERSYHMRLDLSPGQVLVGATQDNILTEGVEGTQESDVVWGAIYQ